MLGALCALSKPNVHISFFFPWKCKNMYVDIELFEIKIPIWNISLNLCIHPLNTSHNKHINRMILFDIVIWAKNTINYELIHVCANALKHITRAHIHTLHLHRRGKAEIFGCVKISCASIWIVKLFQQCNAFGFCSLFPWDFCVGAGFKISSSWKSANYLSWFG